MAVAGPSLLDRLSPDGRGLKGAAALREALRRDLEALLNSRRHLFSLPPEHAALEDTLLGYGLDDMTHEHQGSEEFREEFAEAVERLVRRFEPRLPRFEVTVVSDPDGIDRTLRFRITGVAVLAGERQELHFDSHVDPVQGRFVMRP